MKQILRVFPVLCIILVIACVTNPAFANAAAKMQNETADPAVRIEVAAEAIDESGEFVATVFTRDDFNVAGFKLNLSFDKTKIRPVSVAKGTSVTGGTFFSNLNSGADVSALNYVSAVWYNVSNIEVTAGGILFTARFKVLDGANGLAGLKITVAQLTDQKFADIEFEVIDTTVNLGDVEASEIILTGNTLSKQNDGKIYGNIAYKTVNNTGENPDAVMLLAVYDDKNRLVHCAIGEDTSLEKGDNFGEFADIVILNAAAKNYTVKIFCWESLTTMRPLAVEPLTAQFTFDI